MSKENRHNFNILFAFCRCDLEFVDSVCNEFGNFGKGLSNKTTSPNYRKKGSKIFSTDTETSQKDQE